VAKVKHHAGELFPRIGLIVTNLETPSRAVVRFYNKRGTVEQWINVGWNQCKKIASGGTWDILVCNRKTK
jgi:hypothetical protein